MFATFVLATSKFIVRRCRSHNSAAKLSSTLVTCTIVTAVWIIQTASVNTQDSAPPPFRLVRAASVLT
ncbi:hypothetical protein E2C01_006717 [Portunus trituberculatus]|uniref:Uncharacterized protein n=1 Tax=Portunus trituberculatus TaxID=210409 RepID=A0A5B7CYW1_PORTR|nr:hypothetical protein [Portunus trituberculatus]